MIRRPPGPTRPDPLFPYTTLFRSVGYQSVIVGGIRDPFIIRQIDDWVERLHARVHARVAEIYGGKLGRDKYVFNVRVYGKNGVMGALEPVKEDRKSTRLNSSH